MNNRTFFLAGLWGGLTALAVVGLTYLTYRLAGLPFIPFDIFDWLARSLPGPLITFFIDSMVGVITSLGLGPIAEAAKLAEQFLAIVLFGISGLLFGVLLAVLVRRRRVSAVLTGMLGGALLWLLAALVESDLGFPRAGVLASVLWLAVVFIGWGAVLGQVIGYLRVPAAATDPALSRRQFLRLVGLGSFTLLVTAAGVSLLSDEEEERVAEEDLAASAANTSGSAESPPEAALDGRIPPVEGTRPELTPTEDFYRIDINTFPPSVDAAAWRLEIGGLVERPLSLTLEEIRSRPAVSQVITLECISNPVAGDLISTAIWTGVRARDLIEAAGLLPEAQALFIESVDGFYESVLIEDLMDPRTLLVYEMNGAALPDEHGFPLRIYIPNRFGMKQPKWITRMEAVESERPGYWVERGWSRTAVPPVTSVIDVVNPDAGEGDAPAVAVGGIAYAGARGIESVEVQVDEGPWQEAELRSPPLSPLTWVQWRFFWPAQEGRHIFRVRAYDGEGNLQEANPSPPHPDGATGLHSETAFIGR